MITAQKKYLEKKIRQVAIGNTSVISALKYTIGKVISSVTKSLTTSLAVTCAKRAKKSSPTHPISSDTFDRNISVLVHTLVPSVEKLLLLRLD